MTVLAAAANHTRYTDTVSKSYTPSAGNAVILVVTFNNLATTSFPGLTVADSRVETRSGTGSSEVEWHAVSAAEADGRTLWTVNTSANVDHLGLTVCELDGDFVGFVGSTTSASMSAANNPVQVGLTAGADDMSMVAVITTQAAGAPYTLSSTIGTVETVDEALTRVGWLDGLQAGQSPTFTGGKASSANGVLAAVGFRSDATPSVVTNNRYETLQWDGTDFVPGMTRLWDGTDFVPE